MSMPLFPVFINFLHSVSNPFYVFYIFSLSFTIKKKGLAPEAKDTDGFEVIYRIF